jgi:hypothetical protein
MTVCILYHHRLTRAHGPIFCRSHDVILIVKGELKHTQTERKTPAKVGKYNMTSISEESKNIQKKNVESIS